MKNTFIFIIALHWMVPIWSQQFDSLELATFRAAEDTLEVLADGMLNDKQEERLYFCEKFITQLVKTLKIPHSYHYSFNHFDNISILASGDDRFRIFTWQLEVEKGEYRYYGAIQMNNKNLKLFPLIDRSFNLENSEMLITTHDKWYGAVYYKIFPFMKDRVAHYMLFGYDSNDYLTRIKLLDVLSFDGEGNPRFGSEVFKYPNTIRNRVLINFTADANIRLNFDDKLGMIVFDHLITDTDPDDNRMVPDGSYSGFKYEQGYWVFVEKIFDEVSESPPHEFPLPEEKLKLAKPDSSKQKY